MDIWVCGSSTWKFTRRRPWDGLIVDILTTQFSDGTTLPHRSLKRYSNLCPSRTSGVGGGAQLHQVIAAEAPLACTLDVIVRKRFTAV